MIRFVLLVITITLPYILSQSQELEACSEDNKVGILSQDFSSVFYDCLADCPDRNATCGMICSKGMPLELTDTCSECFGNLIRCVSLGCSVSCPLSSFDSETNLPTISNCPTCLQGVCMNNFRTCTGLEEATLGCLSGDVICELNQVGTWVIPVIIGVICLITIFSCAVTMTLYKNRKQKLTRAKSIRMINNRNSKAKSLNSHNTRSSSDQTLETDGMPTSQNRELLEQSRVGSSSASQSSYTGKELGDMLGMYGSKQARDFKRKSVKRKSKALNEVDIENQKRAEKEEEEEETGGAEILLENNVRASKLPEAFKNLFKPGLTPEMLIEKQKMLELEEAAKKKLYGEESLRVMEESRKTYGKKSKIKAKSGKKKPRKQNPGLNTKALKMMGIQEDDIKKPYAESVEVRMKRIAKAAGGGNYNTGGATAAFADEAAKAMLAKRKEKQIIKEQKRVLKEAKIEGRATRIVSKKKMAELQAKRASKRISKKKVKAKKPELSQEEKDYQEKKEKEIAALRLKKKKYEELQKEKLKEKQEIVVKVTPKPMPSKKSKEELLKEKMMKQNPNALLGKSFAEQASLHLSKKVEKEELARQMKIEAELYEKEQAEKKAEEARIAEAEKLKKEKEEMQKKKQAEEDKKRKQQEELIQAAAAVKVSPMMMKSFKQSEEEKDKLTAFKLEEDAEANEN